MTASIAVLNDNGAALAADSAITIGTGDDKKTYYSQQKIFHLSKRHAVGIMIYNNYEFMEVGWEIIIDEFGKAVDKAIEKEKKQFDNFEDYVDYFLNVFLPDFKYISDNARKEFVRRVSRVFIDQLYKNYADEVSSKYKNNEATTAQKNEILKIELIKYKDTFNKQKMKKLLTEDEYDQYIPFFLDDGDFNNYKGIIEKELKKSFHGILIEDRFKNELTDFIFKKKDKKLNIAKLADLYTGVVFAGYGEEYFFPEIVEFKLYGMTGKRVLSSSYKSECSRISSSIIFSADRNEAIEAFINGIDPNYKKWIYNRLEKLIEKITKIPENDHSGELNELKYEFIKDMNTYEEDHFKDPATRIVNLFHKSELVETAEALVNLTSLRTQISGDGENSVGPVDVALITRRDGFVWIKKKQIFNNLPDNHDQEKLR